jgi:hypothetical protein
MTGLAGIRQSRAIGHAVVFVASAAAFAEEPLVGRLLLPDVGGSIVAWTTTIVFFQVALVTGYLLAAILERKPPSYSLLLLLGICAGPLLLTPILLGDGATGVATRLALIAPGFIALTSVPILMSLRDRSLSADGNPYRLSATSNAGSLLGLAAGLAATELVDLSAARLMWWLAASIALCSAVWLLLSTRLAPPEAGPGSARDAPASRRNRLAWLAYAALASALLVSFTTWVGEQTVVMPLLWVVPLALFLTLFAFVFAVPRTVRGWPLLVAMTGCLVAMLVTGSGSLNAVGIGFAFLVFAIGLWASLRRLEESKPEPRQLASFWILVGVGGAAGGAAATFLAPLLLPDTWEAPALLFVSLALLHRAPTSRPLRLILMLATTIVVAVALTSDAPPMLAVGALVAVLAIGIGRTTALIVALVGTVLLAMMGFADQTVVDRGRNMFGTWKVLEAADGTRLMLSSGTVHGSQPPPGPLHDLPSTYYTAGTGLGATMRILQARRGWSELRATLIGLGVGAISPWSAVGQEWTYIEIDPDVIDFAQSDFSYVADAAASVTLVEGDGRVQLEALPDDSQDLIVLDAYQGDSIPTHLLTDEAFALYRSKLAPGGVIVAHVTNRYLDLAPVVASSSAANGLTALAFTNPDQPGTAQQPSTSAARWVLATDDPDAIAAARKQGWQPVAGRQEWTDERTPLLPTLNFG